MNRVQQRPGFTAWSMIMQERFFNDVLLTDVFICLYIELLKCYTDLAWIINFVPDALNFCVLIFMIRDFTDRGIKITKRLSSLFALMFIVWITITGLFLMGSLMDRYYRYRYILFGFIVYHICIHYMTEEYQKRLLKLLYVSQVLNTILVTYQFIVLNTRIDMTNGIFGFLEYNNAGHGLFCLIMSVIGMEGLLKKNMSGKQSISMILMACYTCALAEIKAFYVLFILGAMLLILLNSKEKRTLRRMLLLILIGMIGLSAAVFLLFKIVPQNLYALTSVEQWAAYESYETGRAEGMGRITQLQYIYSHVFHNTMIDAFMGKGLGADVGWVPYEFGKLFLNFGVLGLALFFSFLLAKAVELYKYRKMIPEAMVGMVMCILTVPCTIVWNATLNRMALLLFVILAIGSARFLENNNERSVDLYEKDQNRIYHSRRIKYRRDRTLYADDRGKSS